jgi:hypothetical protein
MSHLTASLIEIAAPIVPWFSSVIRMISIFTSKSQLLDASVSIIAIFTYMGNNCVMDRTLQPVEKFYHSKRLIVYRNGESYICTTTTEPSARWFAMTLRFGGFSVSTAYRIYRNRSGLRQVETAPQFISRELL